MSINASYGHTAQQASLPAGAMTFPEPLALERVSSPQTVDQAIADLHAHKDRWAQLDTTSKLAILDELYHDLGQQGPEWIRLTLEAKQVPAGGFAEGEEWATYGGVLRLIRLLRQSLRNMERYGYPNLPGRPRSLGNGQISIPTFPTSQLERMLLPGMHAETWLEPGISMENYFIGAGSHHDNDKPIGRVALVLGAGNMGAIQCADLLHRLFVECQVVVLKTNPINAYLGPILEQSCQGRLTFDPDRR